MMMGQGNEWWLPSKRSGKDQIIFVGLDVEPFEDARREDIRNTIIISAILLLLGVGGFLSIIYAQSYRMTRRSLQDTSAFADEVVTNLPVGLIATDRSGNIAFFNAAAEKITGNRFSDIRGKDANDVLPDHWCGFEEHLMQGQPILEQEMECSFSTRKTVPLSVSASRIVNEEGEFVGNIIILRDLGEIRRLQEEVRRKEKLAALGRLAGGVAHEIRNPLSSIKGLATYFGSKFAEESEDRKAANVMVREVDRLNRVVSELLELARPSELKLKQTDLNELLCHSVRLVQQDAQAKNIKINLSTSDDVPLIQVDSDRLSQCLLNIYLNAIQAMSDGGVLSVKSLPEKNGTIKVEIGDTGKGINPNDLKKVFDPYFTTKPSGTGLGLAIVHKIIEAHQGNIKVVSAPGKGTVFSIVLPTRA
jgi:two-component system sensor histidine kinase HydH